MPRVSAFYGIIISMYFNEHSPPHFHATYAEHEVAIAIDTLEIMEGRLPHRAHLLVLEWASLHLEQLRRNWDRARNRLPLDKIEPLPKYFDMVRVKAVKVLDGHRVELELTDGSRKVVDLERYLKGPIFRPIREDREFFESVRVDEELGTIVWPNGADICPDVLIHGLPLAER